MRCGSLWVASLVASTAWAGEGPFYDVRVSTVLEQPGLVVVEAAWPGACGEVDPWKEPRIATYLREKGRGVAVRQDPRIEDLGLTRLGLQGTEVVPLRVGRIDGETLDRTCGCMAGEDLLRWMAGLNKDGRSWASQLAARQPTPAEKAYDVSAWIDVAEAHMCAGRLSDAFQSYWSIWKNTPEFAPNKASMNLRMTTVAGGLGHIAQRDERAHAALSKARDATWDQISKRVSETTYEQMTNLQDVDDWVALNQVLGESTRSADWFVSENDKPTFERSVRRHRDRLVQQMATAGSWDKITEAFSRSDGAWVRDEASGASAMTAAWVAAAARKGGDTSGFKTWAGRLTDVAGDTGGCLLLRATVGAEVASNSEKKYAKKCGDQAIVSAWTAAVGG